MKRWGLLLVLLGIGACGGEPDTAVPAGAPADPAPMAAVEPAADVMGKWARSCALCHVNGEGGAPRHGDLEAWSVRMALGEAQLLQHTVEGYNNMPPLGYCMDCERGDFVALIRFMAGNPVRSP